MRLGTLKGDQFMTLRNAVASVGMFGLMTVNAVGQPKIEKTIVTPTSASSGKEMFHAYCAVCHGVTGKGDGPAASALTKKPADLTQLTAKNAGKFPESRVVNYINGDETVMAHGTRDMPIWGQVLKSVSLDNKSVVQLRISNLIDYVKTLQAK
jgi:mono/diheme cytochrome c family protein